MVEGKEWKTAFYTYYGVFEYLVIVFGLSNTPTNFQYFIKDILYLYLDVFIIAYLNDILTYSNNIQHHQSHNYKILQGPSEASLYLKLEMYKFYY
jgi:hypothetical protein